MDLSKISAFYQVLEELVAAAGLDYCLLGGQASIRHKFAEFTKDFDLHIGSDGAERFLEILETAAQAAFGTEGRVSYRFGLGSPLNARWGRGGWTSHFEIGSGFGSPRVDLFMSLPRVAPEIAANEKSNALHILAETKKTQRDRDWDFVKSFGVKMVEQGDARGFLHIFEAEVLLELKQRGLSAPLPVVELRPVLELLDRDPALMESALLFERMFWQKWDQKRIRCYIEAGREYFLKVRARAGDWATEDLAGQHRELLSCAASCLPESPFHREKVSSLAQEIVVELVRGFGEKLAPYLPNLQLIVHPEGVYNPVIKV